MPSGVLQSLPFHPPKQAQLPSQGWHFPWQEHVKAADEENDPDIKHFARGFAVGHRTFGSVSTFSMLLHGPVPNSDLDRTETMYPVAISNPAKRYDV